MIILRFDFLLFGVDLKLLRRFIITNTKLDAKFNKPHQVRDL